MSSASSYQGPVVIFDGVCVLCNGFVNFIIKVDSKAVIKFLPLQNALQKGLPNDFNLPPELLKDASSVILLEAHKMSLKSDAVLSIASHLPYPWRVVKFFSFIPKILRDAIYDFVAKNRYAWFGKKNQCMIPTEDIKNRFL